MSAQLPFGEGMLNSSVERLRQELDRWLGSNWSPGERAMDVIGLRSGERDWCPPVDVVERGDSIQIDVELPGVDPQAVELTLAGHMLTVIAPIPGGERAEGERVHQSERPRGRFRRSIPLPASVDSESVSAESRLGVLSIRVGKVATARERKIPVRVIETPAGVE